MTEPQINVAGMPEFDALLDHIYEYGTASEGIIDRANAFARALLSRYGRPAGDAQPVAAQETYPQMMPAELSQFLSDVMTAAGLVSHGKQCKALGERLGDACMRLRLHYPEPFAAPVAAQKADDARDAERWRWLRVQPFEVWKRIAWNTWGDDPAVATHRDADIDAAISAQQRQEGK